MKGLGLGLLLAVAIVVGMAASTQALEVEVISVFAAESGPSDPALDSLRPRLRHLVAYRSFRLVHEEYRRCAWRNPEQFALPGGRWLLVTPKGRVDGAMLMQVRLLDGRRRLVDTHVRLRNRGTMLFGVGRHGRSDEGALIVVLKAGE